MKLDVLCFYIEAIKHEKALILASNDLIGYVLNRILISL